MASTLTARFSPVLILLMTEVPQDVADRFHFARVVFEAHSAFGTVGLSMGLTPQLTTVGKLVVTFLMYLGRVGPLTLASAMVFAGAGGRAPYRYAREGVVIG